MFIIDTGSKSKHKYLKRRNTGTNSNTSDGADPNFKQTGTNSRESSLRRLKLSNMNNKPNIYQYYNKNSIPRPQSTTNLINLPNTLTIQTSQPILVGSSSVSPLPHQISAPSSAHVKNTSSIQIDDGTSLQNIINSNNIIDTDIDNINTINNTPQSPSSPSSHERNKKLFMDSLSNADVIFESEIKDMSTIDRAIDNTIDTTNDRIDQQIETNQQQQTRKKHNSLRGSIGHGIGFVRNIFNSNNTHNRSKSHTTNIETITNDGKPAKNRKKTMDNIVNLFKNRNNNDTMNDLANVPSMTATNSKFEFSSQSGHRRNNRIDFMGNIGVTSLHALHSASISQFDENELDPTITEFTKSGGSPPPPQQSIPPSKVEMQQRDAISKQVTDVTENNSDHSKEDSQNSETAI